MKRLKLKPSSHTPLICHLMFQTLRAASVLCLIAYIYQSQQDHIPAEIFSAEMEKIKSLEDELGVELTVGTDWLSGVSESALTTGFILWYGLAALIAMIGAIIRNNVDSEWMSEQVFYPVKLSKFLFLSTVSMGLYAYFWAYKNWRWIRDIGAACSV